MFLLTHVNLFPSARALRDEIQNQCGERLQITVKHQPVGKIAIRWGNSTVYNDGATDMNLNSPYLVKLMSNKKIFSDKYGSYFWVPEFKRTTPSSEDYPLLIRETMTGFGGVGIIPCNDNREFNSNWKGVGYWTKYINLSSEFRVHVFDGEILRIFKKVKEDGVEDSKFNIRNADRGWHFSPIDNPTSLMGLREFIKEFWKVTATNMKLTHGFFALDVGWNRENSKYFVLEGNTAPGIANNPTTCTLYARKFIDVLKL